MQKKMTRFTCSDVDAAKMDLMWRDQQGLCAVTGVQMMHPGQKRHPRVACMTWVPGSTTPVKPILCAYFVTMLARSFPLPQVVGIIQTASAHAKQLTDKPPQASARTVPTAAQIPPDVLRQLGRALNNSMRRAVSRKKLQNIPERHTLTLQHLKDMWVKQNGRCAISGVPMTARRGCQVSPDMLTLDRVDSSLGYTLPNTQLCTFACNLCKSDLSQTDFMHMLASVQIK